MNSNSYHFTFFFFDSNKKYTPIFILKIEIISGNIIYLQHLWFNYYKYIKNTINLSYYYFKLDL